MRGERRKLIAIVMAIALVVAGFYAIPTKKINATTSEIAVTGVPSGAWGGKKDKYQLGTTSDTSADGKWYLEVSQNQWGNWEGSYQNADAIEGFIFNNKVYNNAGGIFLWSSDLKSEYNLTAGQSYTMSVTINYQNVNAAQHNYILTEGGSKNLNDSRVVAAGTSTETYTAVVTPSAADDFVLRVSWTSTGYNTAEKAKITVTDVEFTDPPTTTEGPTTTAAVGDWLDVGTTGSKYRLGVGYDAAANGKWYLEVAQNQWTNWHGRYKYADRIEGFVFDDQVYNNRGGVYLTSTDLKSEFNLTPGVSYNMSVTLNYTGVNAAQHNFIFTEGGTTNMDTTRTVAAGNSSETYTAAVTPAAGDDFVLRISWASVAHETAELGVIEVADVTFTAQETTTEEGYSPCTLGAWAFADAPGTSGWQYFVHANSTGSTFSGGTDIGTPLVIKYGTYVPDADYSCMARSPITTVTPGSSCEGTISVTSTAAIGASGDQLVGASVYSYDSSTGTYDWLANATEAKTNVVANQKTTFHLEYTAPDTGKIIYIITTDYTPVATLTFEATHSEEIPTTTPAPTTTMEPGYSACTLGDWAFTDAPGTSGWQYFVHANSTGSTFKGGSDIDDPLFIKYGTYVPDADYSCMARSPITTVTEGNTCEGTISITSSANIGSSGDQLVGASVYSYNESTGAYDWLANATEARTNIVANQKTTFHLEYTAPATGKIIYIITTDFTPVATLKFEATHNEIVPTTTPAPTTTSDGWIDVPDATVTTVGAWKLFANYAEWAELQYKNSTSTPTDMSDTSIKVKNPTGWYNWNCTAKLENFCRTQGMVYGTPYRITINVNSSLPTATGSTIKVAIDNVVYYFELSAGNNALVIDNFTYFGEYETSDVVFDLSLLQKGTVLNFSSINVVANPDESTSAPTPTTAAPIVDPDIALTGYQINTVYEGFRMVGQIEMNKLGSTVTEYGFVYGLSKIYKPATGTYQDTGITDEGMVVDSSNKYVVNYPSTSEGTIDAQMGNSSTATYFARTMTFGKQNKAAYTSVYKVRVYAKLANNEVVYGDVNDFTVYQIAKSLYDGCLMNSITNHEYLYNKIISKVDSEPATVPFEFGRKLAVPGEKNS